MRKEYVDFLDRFDGGGAGRTGNSFQGGGLLSALANIFATPYGSEDQARRAQRRQALGLLDPAAAPAQAKIQPGAPFAPRTAPPAGDITMSALPPVVPSHLTGPKMGALPPVVPSHLTGPKMGALPPAHKAPQVTHEFVTPSPQPVEAAPAPIESYNLTEDEFISLAFAQPAFEAWLIGQPNVLSLPDQAKRFLNLQLINAARQ
jgi:hypothetical protein